MFRSDPVTDPLPFAVNLVDAPSVPPLPEDWNVGGHAGLGSSVLTQETKTELNPAEPGTITYYAPVRASLAGFAQSVAKNVKGCAFTLLGLFIVLLGLRLAYEHIAVHYNDIHVEGRTNDKGDILADNKGIIGVSGSVIKNCTIELTWEDLDKAQHTCEINTAGKAA